ncbi:MAG: antibiotic biosynthesis monooxygenase [Pseudomonadota bacterium]
MFVAMNRFRIAPGREADFEAIWTGRKSHLDETPGFVSFHLLKGPAASDHVLYCSHSVWESRASFEAWTRSEAFRAAHADAGSSKDLYLEAPVLELFEPVEGA